jgi:hypothetical protein
MHSVGRRQRFSMLKQVVYIEPLDFKEIISQNKKPIGPSQLVSIQTVQYDQNFRGMKQMDMILKFTLLSIPDGLHLYYLRYYLQSLQFKHPAYYLHY